jgi:hypothetical protein
MKKMQDNTPRDRKNVSILGTPIGARNNAKVSPEAAELWIFLMGSIMQDSLGHC